MRNKSFCVCSDKMGHVYRALAAQSPGYLLKIVGFVEAALNFY